MWGQFFPQSNPNLRLLVRQVINTKVISYYSLANVLFNKHSVTYNDLKRHIRHLIIGHSMPSTMLMNRILIQGLFSGDLHGQSR